MNTQIEHNTEPQKPEPQIIHQAIEWTGQSGTCYRYYIWPRGAKIDGTAPGNFLHVKVTDEGVLAPVYIAQSENLNQRFFDAGERECIDENGATQLHLHANYKGEQARLAEEADLVARWQPVCNLRLRAGPAAGSPGETAS